MYRVILLAPAADALSSISSSKEQDLVKNALSKLADSPESPAPYKAKERREGWEMYVGRWKVIYEIRRIESVVYVHDIKEKPSLKFDYH